MGEVVSEENVQILVPLLGIGGGQAIDEVDTDVCEAGKSSSKKLCMPMLSLLTPSWRKSLRYSNDNVSGLASRVISALEATV